MDSRDAQIIDKILRYCNEIMGTHEREHFDKAFFFDAERGYSYRNAIAMPLLQIGELVKHLSAEFQETHTDIPWRKIIRMRDYFAHHYWAVDYHLVWSTSIENIKSLTDYLEKIATSNHTQI